MSISAVYRAYFIEAVCLAILGLLLCCCETKETKSASSYQQERDDVLDMEDALTPIKINVMIGHSWIYILDEYLIVCDHQSPDQGIHIFNKNTFEYITSTGKRGSGPGEIVRYGHVGIDEVNKKFYMSDYGKMSAFRFDLDSVLANPDYMPKKGFTLNSKLFPAEYGFLNDSIIIGNSIDVVDNRSFKSAVIKHNISNGKAQKIGYPNPKIDATNLTTYFAMSKQDSIYVEGYADYDLLTINDLEGNVLHNIYGPLWENRKSEENMMYFGEVSIWNSNILAAYIGGKSVVLDEHKRPRSVLPTKLLIFDTDGNYQKTLETGYGMYSYCIDEENDRMIVSSEDIENQLGYIDLKEVNAQLKDSI